MRSRITTIILSVLISSWSYGQTTISDKKLVSGTWIKSKSPYIIEREAIVPEGSTLTIEPGVRVEFKMGREADYLAKGNGINKFDFDMAFLRIEGRLIANGTKEEPIFFTNHDSDGRSWGVIYFSQSTDNQLTNCVIENSGRIVNISTSVQQASAAITLFESNAEIINTTIKKGNYGIELNNSELTFQNCIVEDIVNFAVSGDNSTAIINKSTFRNNEWTFSFSGKVNISVTNSLFHGNYSDFDERFLNFFGDFLIENSAFQIQKLPKSVAKKAGNIYGIELPFESSKIGAEL